MEKRLAAILEAAVESFINFGEPISSGWLYDHYNFGIKPAMIRLELERLADEGFLEQPHHSAGRVPSNKGYEFFAERALTGENNSAGPLEKTLRSFFNRGAWPDLVDEMSASLGVLSVANDLHGGESYKEGLDNLVENLEWESPKELRSVVKDFVEIDERLNRLRKDFFSFDLPQVFIGKKSPVTKSESLSVVMGNYQCGNGKITLLAIGPKRMNYKKTLKTFSALGGATSRRKNINGRKK